MATVTELEEIKHAKELIEAEPDDPMSFVNSFHFTQGEIQVDIFW